MNNPHRSRRILLAVVGVAIVTIHNGLFIRRVHSQELPPRKADSLKPLEKRVELVKSIADEDTESSINNLANFDDAVWADSTVAEAGGVIFVSYRYSRLYVLQLKRVRKIIAELRSAPSDDVIQHLKDRFAAAMEGFDDVFRAKHRQLDEAAASGSSVILSELDEHYYRLHFSPAAAYVLAELKCYDALPLMADALSKTERIPISQGFLFYSMHL
ncbi:MAG: hypothetical protein WD065_16115 [Planctomycetaceae bacterium]